MISLFNEFRYNKNSNKNSDWVLRITDKYKNENEFRNYLSYFADINFDNFNREYKSIYRYRSPADIMSYMIEAVCVIVLKISEINSPRHGWVNKMAVDVAKYVLSTIVESDKLLAQYQTFNFKIFGEPDNDDENDMVDDGGTDNNTVPDYENYEPSEFSFHDVDIDEDNPNIEAN
jgi:hypothetical protein